MKWLEDAVKVECFEIAVGKPAEFDTLEYNLVAIGSSVYGGKIREAIMEFVKLKTDTLAGKKVVVIIVCKEVRTPQQNVG